MGHYAWSNNVLLDSNGTVGTFDQESQVIDPGH